MVKDDTLKSYIAVKDEKENLKSEISALRRILENTSGASKEIFGGMGELMIGGIFVDEVATAQREGSGDLGFRLYEIFSRSKDRLSLDYNLFAAILAAIRSITPMAALLTLRLCTKGRSFIHLNSSDPNDLLVFWINGSALQGKGQHIRLLQLMKRWIECSKLNNRGNRGVLK